MTRPAICRACPHAREVTEADVDCANRGVRISFAAANGASEAFKSIF